MPNKDHGPSIKDPELYEELRKEGESKEKAARCGDVPDEGHALPAIAPHLPRAL